ncbi:MAG: DEAD/DEAH box helicase [Candidatus Woesearchaeota archaeon]|jgi:ATP-dependent RNA helicase DeaD|nr:DEAD/DEAH box helicase [Candidatus Woesearchaeota archaeon]
MTDKKNTMKDNTTKDESKVEANITFDKFDLSDNILKTIEKKGFKIPSEIQAKVIPLMLENTHDIIGVAQTGTGKTAAFGLPIIEMIEENNKTPKAIVIAPTRELAIQVCDEMSSYIGSKRLRLLTVYGGTSISTQIRELSRGIDIVVGTPGRILDLINREKLDLAKVEYFVLDEADEMLKMGFIEDIEMILSGATNKFRKTLLFSATMPDRIKKLTKKYMKNQIIVEAKRSKENNKLIDQIFYVAKQSEKTNAVARIIESQNFFYGIIFCKTKADVDDLTQVLKKAGHDADCIHGDIIQSKRERILGKFRDLKLNILVATDVAARGIDVNNLTHVINYSLPKELEIYTHRIGRTGRAGNKGIAISLVTPREISIINQIERITKSKIRKELLPSNRDVESAKTKKVQGDLGLVISSNKHESNLVLSEELLAEYDAKDLVAALLYKVQGSGAVKSSSDDTRSSSPRRERGDSRSSRGDSRDSYNDRSAPRGARGIKVRGDQIRLFVAKGQRDGFNSRSLLNFIEKEANTGELKGNDIKVCENFSFVTLKAKDAEDVLKAFEDKGGRRPVIEVASN